MSTSISQLLQVTAPQASPPKSGGGGEFESFLTQASEAAQRDSADRPTEAPTEEPVQNSADEGRDDRPLASTNEQPEEQDSAQVEPSVEQDSSEPSDDELELSDAAAILSSSLAGEEAIIFEAAVESTLKPAVVDVTANTAEVVDGQELLIQESVQTTEFATVEGLGHGQSELLAADQQPEATPIPVTNEGATDFATVELPVTEPTVDAVDPSSGEQAEGQSEQSTQVVATETGKTSGDEFTATNQAAVAGPVDSDLSEDGESEERPPSKTPATEKKAAVEDSVVESKLPEQQAVSQVAVPEQSADTAEATPRVEPTPQAAESKPNATVEAGSTEQPQPTQIETEPVPTQDRVRFVQRVSRAFQSARSGGNEIQLKLSPPELGTLRLSISVEQGALSAKVETETAAARNVLLDNLPALRERLAEQDIRVDKFDVDVGQDGEQSSQERQLDAKDRQSSANARGREGEQRSSSLPTETSTEASPPLSSKR